MTRKSRGELPETLDEDAIASLLVAAADGLQVKGLLNPGSFNMGDRLEYLSRLLYGAQCAARPGAAAADLETGGRV